MIHLSVGVSGSGKTHGVRQAVLRALAANPKLPVLVIDREEEAKWQTVPTFLKGRVAIVASVKEARQLFKRGARLVVVRSLSDPGEVVNDACRWACKWPGIAGVVIPEAHDSMPNRGTVAEWASIAVTKWRHRQVELWIDTQRFALLWTTAVNQASEDTKLYAMSGPRDIALVHGTWGPECVAAVRACAAKVAQGEKGWHVVLGIVRMPPFRIARDPA